MGTIKSIKLVAGGDKGVEIIRAEYQKKEGLSVCDDVKRKRSIPIPSSLRDSMKKLRIHYLTLLKMYQPEWDGYLKESEVVDKSLTDAGYKRCVELFESTSITGIKHTPSGWSIEGLVESCTGEAQKIATVGVLEGEENYLNSGKMYEDLRNVVKEVKAYFDNDKVVMMPGEQYVLKFGKEGEEVENKEEWMMNELIGKGFLVLEPDEMGIENADKKEEEIILPITDAVAGSQEAVEEFSKTELGKKVEKIKINKSKKEETVHATTEGEW